MRTGEVAQAKVRSLIDPRSALAAERIDEADLAQLNDVHERSLTHDAADEASVAALCALNDDFHRVIVQAAGSPRLTRDECRQRHTARVPRELLARSRAAGRR